MSAHSIQIQVNDTIHEVGDYGDAHLAASYAHVEASRHGDQDQPASATEAAIKAGEKSIVIRNSDPTITVLVS